MEFVAAANMTLALFEALMPIIAKQVKAGQVPPEEQKKLRDRFDALRKSEAFSGPEWEL